MDSCFLLVCPLILLICLILGATAFVYPSTGDTKSVHPIANDPNFSVELMVDSLNDPVAMDFLGPDDLLVTDRQGSVTRIINGTVYKDPLLVVHDISTDDERGMLGIATHTDSNITLVFVYFTESIDDSVRNRLYKYNIQNGELTNPELLIDLPASPGPAHNGGVVAIGPDDNVYITVGDLRPSDLKGDEGKTKAQNYNEGPHPDGRAGILRVDKEGEPVGEGILGNEYPLNLYYAYGIRNSFGIDFDPLTGNIWETENGPTCCDELNLFNAGSNGGWAKILGFWRANYSGNEPEDRYLEIVGDPEDLVSFNGSGRISYPRLVWEEPVGVTAIVFLDSNKYGSQYEYDLLIGDYNNGNIYQFDLDKGRTGLVLEGELADMVADSTEELEARIFAKGFAPITDLEVGPDGLLYVLTGVRSDNGKVYRIEPTHELLLDGI